MSDKPWIFKSEEEKLDSIHHEIGDMRGEIADIVREMKKLASAVDRLVEAGDKSDPFSDNPWAPGR